MRQEQARLQKCATLALSSSIDCAMHAEVQIIHSVHSRCSRGNGSSDIYAMKSEVTVSVPCYFRVCGLNWLRLAFGFYAGGT